MMASNHASPRRSAGYLAFLLHRLSGLALALFLPFHFLVLGLAIEGEARLDRVLAWTDQPLVKFAEWGLVVLLTLHLMLGLRVLLLEWAPWRGDLRSGWIGGGIILAVLAGIGFILGVG
ncbi:succinate dehydrogenase [Alphaproteobacteria bacterium LSUCC0684]